MLQDILTKQKRFFDPAVHTELRGQLNRQRRVILLSGNVVANSRSDVSGVSARVWRGGTCGFSSMAEYSEEAARKVLQAAGRLVRTADDYGVIALMDERFLKQEYREQFPREWSNGRIWNDEMTMQKDLRDYWSRMEEKSDE